MTFVSNNKCMPDMCPDLLPRPEKAGGEIEYHRREVMRLELFCKRNANTQVVPSGGTDK